MIGENGDPFDPNATGVGTDSYVTAFKSILEELGIATKHYLHFGRASMAQLS